MVGKVPLLGYYWYTVLFYVYYVVLYRILLRFQDGFYEGELMNGKRGLVPSNFVEKVPGEYNNTPFL